MKSVVVVPVPLETLKRWQSIVMACDPESPRACNKMLDELYREMEDIRIGDDVNGK